MRTLSSRYAIAALGLALAALVLTRVGAREGHVREDCANPAALEAPDFLDSVKPFERNEPWQSDVTPLWTRGAIDLDMKRSPKFEVIMMRSFDPIRLYLQPDGLSPMHAAPDKGTFEWAGEGEDRIPVHFLYTRSKSAATWRTHFTAYMFIFHNRPDARPFLTHLGGALPDLFEGRRPLTVLMVKGAISNAYLEVGEKRAREWLRDSWQRYAAACAT